VQDSKPRLVLLHGNALLREQIASKLASLYTIKTFSSTADALRFASVAQPAAVLISEEIAVSMQFALVKSMRLDPLLGMMSIIILLDEHSPDRRAAALQSGASACLEKPYNLKTFVPTISSALNATVENRWESLPLIHAAALKCSIAIFGSVSERMSAGKSIAYSEINAACEPLLTAVNSEQVRTVLQGVRDHDNYTFSHSLRVAIFLGMFGRTFGLSGDDQNVLTIGGLLHDLGKTHIPSLILNKAGPLNDEELEIMKGHVPATLKMLEQCPELPRGAIIIASQHHERLDGSGYPNGLSGTQLNELARMAAIADVFGALTDRRVYKPDMPPEQAFRIMSEEMNRHLDMSLLERFRQMLLDTSALLEDSEKVRPLRIARSL
jgi:HD-GYP domain-containing protein (c-di-GMP phosphodiesterase class II)